MSTVALSPSTVAKVLVAYSLAYQLAKVQREARIYAQVRRAVSEYFGVFKDQSRDEGGRFSSGSGNIALDPEKIKKNPIPKDLKAKWSKDGGVDNPEYKKWISAHWAQEKKK